ncbi:hypothetical protein NC652_026427 [Populus alba x Populus x berolinensis]|nr:hypothetical protein NC652_026427 [Populus alba x Populus x berolinensis]
MAHLLNVSLCTKIPQIPPLSLTKPSLSIPRFHPLSHSRCPNPQVLYYTSHSSSSSVLAKLTFSLLVQQQALILNKQLLVDFAKTGLLALLSVSLSFTDPALAFKGGGPYGSEVTRGQDLTGKDFSGRTLIKQDFKTSILRQANFKGAKLLGASFFDADLTGADLSDADLRSADLSLANVAKVNLSNANLEGALATGNTSFRGSNITGAGMLHHWFLSRTSIC